MLRFLHIFGVLGFRNFIPVKYIFSAHIISYACMHMSALLLYKLAPCIILCLISLVQLRVHCYCNGKFINQSRWVETCLWHIQSGTAQSIVHSSATCHRPVAIRLAAGRASIDSRHQHVQKTSGKEYTNSFLKKSLWDKSYPENITGVHLGSQGLMSVPRKEFQKLISVRRS